MSIALVPPNVASIIALHSMCHPGLPFPHGLSHSGSPGFAAFQSAKSAGFFFRSSTATRSPARLSSSLRPLSRPYSGSASTAKYTSPSPVGYANPSFTKRSVMSMMSPMCAVALGSSVGGRHPRLATSSWKASMNRSTNASHVSPFSFARAMILSSTSVKLRQYVTS